MNFFIEVFIVGLILSADSFSAAMAMGARPCTRKDALKFAFASGGAEASVALLGALAGVHVVSRFAAVDHWIAFGLLAGVALHMAYEGVMELLSKEEKELKEEFHSFTKILIVSIATSLDAFGVGIGLGVADKPIAPFIISSGLWAFASTLLGLYLSRKLSQKFGPIMSIVGAVVLGVMAVEMLKI